MTRLQIAAAFEPLRRAPRETTETESRPGDSAGAYARGNLARIFLGRKAERTVEDGIRDSLCYPTEHDTVLGATGAPGKDAGRHVSRPPYGTVTGPEGTPSGRPPSRSVQPGGRTTNAEGAPVRRRPP